MTQEMSDQDRHRPQWWGYLHANGTPQLKYWTGDVRDYTDDCKDNPFVITVVEPFHADTREQAWRLLYQKLGFNPDS